MSSPRPRQHLVSRDPWISSIRFLPLPCKSVLEPSFDGVFRRSFSPSGPGGGGCGRRCSPDAAQLGHARVPEPDDARHAPIKSMQKVSQHVSDLMPEGQRIAIAALKALLCPIQQAMHMDEADAADASRSSRTGCSSATRSARPRWPSGTLARRPETRRLVRRSRPSGPRSTHFLWYTLITYDNLMCWMRS